MLTRANRLTATRLFSETVGRGRRAGSATLVVHVCSHGPQTPGGTSSRSEPLVGLVVGKGVGAAVVRNQVKRRLRHLMRERVGSLPRSCLVVVRALPGAADASFDDLGADLDRVLDRVLAHVLASGRSS